MHPGVTDSHSFKRRFINIDSVWQRVLQNGERYFGNDKFSARILKDWAVMAVTNSTTSCLMLFSEFDGLVREAIELISTSEFCRRIFVCSYRSEVKVQWVFVRHCCTVVC